MTERKTKEVAFLEERFKRVEKNERELHALRVRDAEEYNETKVKLETDVQVCSNKKVIARVPKLNVLVNNLFYLFQL